MSHIGEGITTPLRTKRVPPPSILSGYHLQPNILDRLSIQEPTKEAQFKDLCWSGVSHSFGKQLTAIKSKVSALLASSWPHGCPHQDQAEM